MPDVYIAEGHGRRPDGSFDPGATDGIHSEQRDSKPVAEACTARLRAAGVDVESESDLADDPNFYGTTARANQAGVKCVVSFHYDWNQAPPGAFGISTSDDGLELRRAIESRVADVGFDIRDYPDDRDGLYLLDNSHAPAVIFECGRIGHHAIDEAHEQRAMGEAAALGILDWLGKDPMFLPINANSHTEEIRHVQEMLGVTASGEWDFPNALEGLRGRSGTGDGRDHINGRMYTQLVDERIKRGHAGLVARMEDWVRAHVKSSIAAAIAAGAGSAQIDYGQLVQEIGRVLAG